jgi:ABC-2 type transport system ATP-binding protein
VTLQIERGASFGLLGPNGAGKTTLLKLMLGIARPTAGSVQLFDRAPEDPAVRRRIGYLPERLALPPSWTPLAWLASAALLKRSSVARNELLAVLERVGLEAVPHKKIGAFSKGMRQRLGLATALLGQPDLLVLDEPTDGIDPRGRADVREILEEERKRGATIFLNSHLLSETERICDQVGILDQGILVQNGRTLDLCGAPNQWRIRVQGNISEELASQAHLSATGEPNSFVISAGDVVELNQSIDLLRRSGIQLVELGRMLRTLEDVMLEVTTPEGDHA